ncbi:SpoIIE family protein phosphatase [Streptomyces smyrnaeus]|uniref:SpoIIE family protein phosphatase n=1 Tax=Streptomyces smyrnaeus TaxID=1387713 RepID=A0ABS3Y3V0_9ACTN|nr:PP2C family protein-serine/threonine phosphatase [Streptomyces smyrnaeus]MBO8202178.1 SpoIIE family protein phosphatase [Streptomyces smyrnaeus]
MRQREAGTETATGYDDSGGRLWRLARQLPAALFALGIVLELATPRDVAISAPFAAAPLAAAAVLSLWGTVLTSVLASSATILFAFFHDTGSTVEAEARSVTNLTVSALAVGVNYVLRRSGSRLASARGVAEAVQLAVLPAPPSHVGDLVVATRYRAAQAETRVGGDFYAAEETPYGVRLLLGDVRGKGLDSVAAVVLLVGVFREAAEQEETLSDVAARLDRALRREGRRQPGTAGLEGFSTAVLVEISAPSGSPAASGSTAPAASGSTAPAASGSTAPAASGSTAPAASGSTAPAASGSTAPAASGSTAGGGPARGEGSVLRLVNRGHPAPLLLHRGNASPLEPTVPALPLGMSDLGSWPEHIDEFPFPRGAQLLLYTDGLSEARDSDGDFYDPIERLSNSYFDHPEELLETVLIDVAAHTGGRSVDDLALLAVAHDSSTP